ncbi:MAG: hypothetical protein WD229_15365, partial [Pirellulales bacterium]
MRALVVAEHDGEAIRAASLACLSFAKAVADARDGTLAWLVLGDRPDQPATEAAQYAPVFVVDSPIFAQPLAEPVSRAIATVVRSQQFDLVCGASSTFAKDVLPRAAALLGGAMASDVVRYEFVDGRSLFDCPQYAGAIVTTLRLIGTPQIVTVRASAYPAAQKAATPSSIERVELGP